MTYVIQKDPDSEKFVVRIFLDETQKQYGATVFCKDQDEAEKALHMLTGDQTVKLCVTQQLGRELRSTNGDAA